MSTYNAIMQIQVDTSDANKRLAEVDKNLTSIRSTSSDTSSSLKRLEGTFTRIEKTMASVDRTMRGVFSVMKMMSKANLSLNGSFQTLNKSVTGIDKNVSKFSSNIHLLSKRYANLQNKVNDLNRELRKLKANAGSADSALSKTEKSLEKGSGTLDLFNKKIKISGYLFTVLAQAALNFIQTNIVGYLIRATDQFILLENRIRLVNDSITTFNVNMKSAASVALETRQNLFAVGNLMARVGRNSKELAANSRELAQVTSTVSKSFIIAGATAEEARNAIVQLSQALASGRLQGDELRSILELAPTLAQSISKSIGITVGELRSFASEGLITTKIIVSAMLESTSEINEAFSKMQPTVSQALETLRTSMQVTLGSVDSFKDANFSLAMSLTKLGAIIRNMLGSEALAGLGEVLDKIAQNIIPLIAGFTTFVGVLLTLTGVSYGVSKAITAIQVAISAGPGGLIALLIRLGVVIASFVAAKKVFDGMSSSMGFLSSQTRSYSKVVEDTAKEIEGLEKKTGKALDETEKLTIEYRNLALELSQINLAIQELEKEQKKVQNNLISLESDTKTFFRKISYVVESVVKMILASILNLANIVATSIIDSFIGMVEVAAKSADWISQNFGLDIFSGAVASVQNLRAEFRKMMGDARRANVEMFDPFGGGVTDAIMGKQPFGTDKKREAEIDAQLALEKAKREEFEAQMKKLEEERAEKARDLFLKSFEAQIEASKNLVDVQAKEMRKIFELQFSKPFDLRFTPAQQALSDFATSFTQDMQKEIEKRVPESKVDLTKFFDLESAGSPFKAENLFQIVKDLKKNIDSNFKFSEEEVKNIFNLDRIIDTIFNDESIKKKVEEAGEKSILRDLFTGSATSLLYKNAEKLAQELINIELNFAKQMAEMERSYGIDDKKSKLMIKINKDQIKSLEKNSGYREQILESTRQQSVLEANIILERMASEGFDKARLERARELLDIQTENLVVLREQEIAIEAARDKRALEDEVKLKVRDNFLLEAEVSLYKQAISPIERVKKLQEEKDKVEENILRNQLTQKGYTEDQVDAIAEILKNKQYQLNKEQEISKELEYQKELQKSEQDLAKEQLLAQTRAFIAAKKNAMSLAEQFSIATGAKADPFSGMEERISKEFDIYISQDIPEYMLQFKEGVLGVADEYRDKMTDEEKERLERARELVSIQDQINEQQKKFYKYTEGFFDSLTIKLGQSLKDFGIQKGGMREVRKAGGGMLSGPSHANGGINGVLYGQGIELEGGEYVISKDAVAKYGVPLFDALNAQKFQGGGLMAGSYGKSPSAGEAATARANLAVSSMAASMVAHQFEEMSYSMKALKETTDELSESNKTGIASVDSLAEKYKDAPVYGQPGTGSPAGMTDDTKIAIENLTKAVETNTEVEQLAASKDDDSFTAKAKSLYNTVMTAVNDPVTAALNLTYDALLQNERFQKVQERFMTLVYSAFDGIAEGLAIFFEALLDAVEPLRPILEMIGDTFKGLFRGLTRVIQPFARLIESITPILIYISGFLQILVGLISSIFGIIGSTIDGIFSAIINGLGIETSEDKYKSLNLLRQERDIISEINTSISGLGETLKEIQDVIFEIMNSALNIAAPGVKLDLAAEKYNELYAAATAIGADEDAIQDYQNFTKVYLQQAQDVLKTSSAYQQIYVQVIDDLQSLQEASAAAVGADITEALKKGIFDLQVAGSPMGDMISDAVEVYRKGYISYNDLLTYIGYKLAQIGQDIDLKDFAEFGSIGDFSEVEKAFYEYRDDAVQQWESSMGAAISSSSIDTDFEKLFGIDYQTGQRIKDAIALQESEMVLAVEQGRANALKRIQPEIGDVTPSDPNFTRDTGTTGGVDFNFDLGIDFDLFGGLVTTLESIFTQLDVPTSFAEFKDNWDHWMTQLQLPDLGSWDKFKEWWDGIGFPDLSGDLTEGWNTFKTNWDNLWSTLTLQDVDLDIGGQLQSAVNSVFGDPKSLLDKLRMLKNPFYPAIQPDYLIEFGKGGLLDGPSHDNGGILANVRGRGPIELEGGEYIINKKTVSSLGTGFLSMINGITNKGDLTNAIADIPKFEGGGSTNQDEWNKLNYGGGDNKNKEKETIAKMFDLKSSQYERFGFDVTDSIKNVTDILYVRGTDKDKVTPKRNPNAPSSMSDPMRLIEPQSYMNTFDLFDVEIGTRGWFKSLIGDHGIEASMGFPYGSNFRNWETGGLIPKFEGGGDTYGLQWTGFTSGEVNQFKSYGGQKVTPEKMLAKNRFGSFNETRRADNLQYKEERERMNVDTSFLSSIGVPDYVTGAISSAIDGIIGSGWGLITSSLDLMGTFGANIGNYLTSISALGGLFGGGDASREEWNLGELIMLGIGLTSLVSMFTEMGGGKGMGLTDVGDWIELFSFGNYKKTPGSLADITWAWVPAFLSLAPLFTTDREYDEKGSVWDWLSITTDNFVRSLLRMRDKGGEDLGDLTDRLGDDALLATLIAYGAYEGAVNLFDLDMPSLFGGKSKSFSFGSNSSSGASSRFTPVVPNFLSRGNVASRYSSYKGFAKGGRVGGLAVGPSHDSGMLGMTTAGSPFLFEGGEYIMNRNAVSAIGPKNLDLMNEGYFPIYSVEISSLGNRAESQFDQIINGGLPPVGMFGSGGLLTAATGMAVGPSHQSGMLGMTKNGAPFLFEGGEYIISKDAAESIGVDNLHAMNKSGSFPFMMGSGGSLKTFRSAGSVSGSWMDTWGEELPKEPEYLEGSIFEDLDVLVGAENRVRGKRSLAFLRNLGKYKKPRDFSDIFDANLGMLSLISLLGGVFPDKSGMSDFNRIERGRADEIPLFNALVYLSTLGYAGTRFYQWWKSGKPVFGGGGELPEAGIGDYLGWLWPGNWLPDGPKKGSVYYPFMATPYRGVSGSGLLPWNWFDDDIKGPDTSSAARDVWWEALVKYGNIFNWFGNGGSLTEAATGMSLFGLGTAGFGAMSILADAGMLPGNFIFGSPLGSRQNKGSAGSQALTAAQAISWALGSIGLFSSMSGGKRSGEMGLLSLVLMGLGATGFKSGSKNYLNPATWGGTQKYNRSKFGSGGFIPSFGYGGRSGSGMRKFGDSPGLDLLSSLLLLGTFNELYQSQVRRGGGKNNVSMLLQLVGLLGTGLSGYASYKSLTSGNWSVGGKSGSLPYLFKERSMFGSGGTIPSFGNGGAELAGLGMKGLMTYAFGQSIFDFIMSDNKFSTPKGSPANQLNPFIWMSLMGLLHQTMMKGVPTKYGSGGDIPSFGQGRAVGSSNVLDWIWPWDTKGSIDSLFDWSSQGIASASMDFLDLGWWGKNFSLWSWLDFGNGGSIPSYKTGDLLDLLGKKRRKSAFENGLFELSAMGDVSRSRVIRGRGKRDDSWGFLNYLMLMLSIGGLGAAISNNKKLFGFGSGGSLQAGGIAKGPSHQSGMVGYARGGMPFLFEGGEYIVRKDSVDKLGVPLLDMLNSGMMTMGSGGLLSFQGGTTNYPQTIDQLLLARRDLFGLQKITKTTEDGGTQDVYVVNPEDIAGLGTSDAKLLEGIQKTLTSLLVTVEEEIPVTDETGVTTMEKQLKISTLALETALGMDISLAKYTSGIFSAVTDEQANALRSAGIEPGMLLRVSLDYLGNVAFAQFASIMAAGRGGGPSFEDELLKIILPAIFESMGATGGAAALGVFGIMYGRETAETGKQDIAVAAGLVAGYLAMGAGGWAVAAAALVAAEVFGKPENYFAEIGIDEQMDLQEPVTGLYDELMNPRDGLLTFPANYFSNIGDEKLPEIQARLDEGMMRMTMNSQKLAGAMERAFGMDEGALQFDMAAGLETTYESVNSLSKIGDRLGELEEIVTKPIEDIIAAIARIINFPAESFNKLGEELEAFFGGSLGELLKIILSIPIQIADQIKRSTGSSIEEFIRNATALFLGITFFPVTLLLKNNGLMGESTNEFIRNMLTFLGGIALMPLALSTLASIKIIEYIDQTISNLQGTFLFEIANLPIRLTALVSEYLLGNFFGSFLGIFDSFLGEILMIPNMLLQETINFVTGLPARLLAMFGIQFPFFELNALKNPFHGTLGGPEYLIDLEIGEKSEGDGGLINYGKGGVLQTGGLAVGPSHQSGMLGLTNQGTPFLFEGGEYIVNKKTTDLLGHDFMAEVNAISSDKDLKNVFSLLSMFEPGGGLFDLGMNDNPLSSVFTIPNPLKSLTGPDEFNIAIDPSEDLSGIDVEQNLFQKGGGLFDIAGNVFGNSFKKDFLTVDNPFRKAIKVVERYQREVKKYGFLGRVVGTFMEWATRTVTKMVPLGPDELTLGIDGYLLDFYNSKLTSNFGGDVLEKLGIDSLPTPSMKNGGPVFGRSHALGGIIAELEGGEFVINKDSADEMGSEFLSSLNSRGNGSFVGSLVQSSFATNELLGKLISVVEDKDMSVMVVDSSGEERPSSKIKISQDREMSYRGARMLA